MLLTSEQAIFIHDAIHRGIMAGARINGQVYKVGLTPQSKCHFIDIGPYRFVEQNVNSGNPEWAEQAKQGAKITWVIHKTKRGAWGRIVDGAIQVPILEG